LGFVAKLICSLDAAVQARSLSIAEDLTKLPGGLVDPTSNDILVPIIINDLRRSWQANE